MDKTLRTGLVIVGVVSALVLVAFATQAAGLTSNARFSMPGYGMQGSFAGGGGMMGSFQGSANAAFGGMQASMMSGMMAMVHGGNYGQFGTMDMSQMPHHNQDSSGNFENCPYWQDSQDEQ